MPVQPPNQARRNAGNDSGPIAAGDVKHIWWRGTHAMCQVQGRAAQDFCQNGQTVVVGNHKHTAPILIASVPHLSQNSGCSNKQEMLWIEKGPDRPGPFDLTPLPLAAAVSSTVPR